MNLISQFSGLENAALPPAPLHLAIGMFDGVHLGHREVIRGADTVLTFDPHPQAVINPASAPKLLNPPNVKADLIAGLGVEELVTIPFDRDFASKTAEEFVQEVVEGGEDQDNEHEGDHFGAALAEEGAAGEEGGDFFFEGVGAPGDEDQEEDEKPEASPPAVPLAAARSRLASCHPRLLAWP